MINETMMKRLMAGEPLFWANETYGQLPDGAEVVQAAEIAEAQALWQRFAPLLAECFPETAAQGGLIESPLREIGSMQRWLGEQGRPVQGRLFLKMDSHLAIAGSVKARGGIFEVLS